MKSFSEFVAGDVPEEYVPLIRELMSWDCRCPNCMVFSRNERGLIFPNQDPSPLHWSRQIEWPWVLKHADIQPHHTVLDIGGGWAVLQYSLASRCKEVISLDIDQNTLDKAAESIKLFGIKNITQVQGDARSLPYEDCSFDRVISVSTIEHIPGKGAIQACKEIKRILKPGGLGLITMDITVEKENQSGNFYINASDAEEILAELDVKLSDQQAGISAWMAPEGVHIFVLMIFFVKGVEGVQADLG